MEKAEDVTGGMESRRLCIRLKVLPKGRGGSCQGGGEGGSEKVISEDPILAEGVLLGKRSETVEQQEELQEEVGSFKNTRLPLSPEDEEKPQQCWVCLKKFSSPKSLCGHMRKHPEREWRGVQPPTKEVKKERDTDYPQAVVSGWLTTGKRGRSVGSVGRGLNSASTTAYGSSMPEPREGKDVIYPTLMSNKEPTTSARVNLPNDGNFLPRGDQETGSCSRTKTEIEIPPEQKPQDEPRVEAEKVSGITSCTGLEDQKLKRTKKRKATEIDGAKPSHHAKSTTGERSGDASSKNYKCITCQKSFPTFWALGGHRSSCNKTRQSSTAQAKEANTSRKSSPHPQAAAADKPGTCSQNPWLDLSLSLPLLLSPYTTPSSSTIEDNNACCNPTTGFQGDMNLPACEEDAEDNERKMIKFL